MTIAQQFIAGKQGKIVLEVPEARLRDLTTRVDIFRDSFDSFLKLAFGHASNKITIRIVAFKERLSQNPPVIAFAMRPSGPGHFGFQFHAQAIGNAVDVIEERNDLYRVIDCPIGETMTA